MKLNHLFFIVSILLFSSCKEKQQKENENQEYVSCYTYDGRPSQALTYKEVVSMLKHYDVTRKGILKDALKKEDTRENFFLLDDLKKYIAYVEKLAKDKNIKVTGINFISAAYPDNYYEKEKQNYQTLILVPTTTRGKKINVSFDPLHSGNKKPKYFNDILAKFDYFNSDGKKVKRRKSRMEEDMESSAANRAKISPPY